MILLSDIRYSKLQKMMKMKGFSNFEYQISLNIITVVCKQPFFLGNFLGNFWFSSDIFISTRRMIIIFSQLHSPELGEGFKYPERTRGTIFHDSTAIWSENLRQNPWKVTNFEFSKHPFGMHFQSFFNVFGTFPAIFTEYNIPKITFS